MCDRSVFDPHQGVREGFHLYQKILSADVRGIVRLGSL